MYVRARDEHGAARAAKRWAYIVHRLPEAKLLVDHLRFLTPEDVDGGVP